MNKQNTVLIIDDSELDRHTMCQVLERKSFHAVAIDDGKNFIEVIENQKPDIILLDIMMPTVHGNQVLHQIRKKYNQIELPVIMISAKSDASDVIEMLQLGANDYLVKPVDFDIALMRINTHLRIKELSAEKVRLKELEAIHAIVTTYNHEINNPLAIAIGSLKTIEPDYKNKKEFLRLEEALWRTSEIVKKIKDVCNAKEIDYEMYLNEKKMVKVRK